MKNSNLFYFTILFSLFFINSVTAKTFTSVQSGNWTSSSTWDQIGYPGRFDDIVIDPGHTVTISSSNYTHSANITVEEAGTLVSNTLKFNGYEFHVFGDLEVSGSNNNLIIEWFSVLWAHPTSTISISGDLKLRQVSSFIVEGTCIDVNDDFIIIGSFATLCGSGGISIGPNSSQNKIQLNNGATSSQICTGTEVLRGTGANCTTLVLAGTGNNEPVSVDDSANTDIDTPLSIDALSSGTPDSDPDEDGVWLWSAGTNGINGTTDNGGTVTINYNGSWWAPSDC